MSKSLRTSHHQIARQIQAVERAVLTFQSGMIKSAGCSAGVDTNTAIILCARLSTVWKRIGEMIPRGKKGRGASPNASSPASDVVTERTQGTRNQ
jgi:hypothetical protein